MRFNINIQDITEEDMKEKQSIEPIPVGTYKLECENWEDKESKNRNMYIAVQFNVLSPGFAGKKLWENFAVGAPKAKIAKARLKAWAHATGQVLTEINSETLNELIGRPFKAKVGIDKSRDYDAKNKIKEFIFPEYDDPEILEKSDTSVGSEGLDESLLDRIVDKY